MPNPPEPTNCFSDDQPKNTSKLRCNSPSTIAGLVCTNNHSDNKDRRHRKHRNTQAKPWHIYFELSLSLSKPCIVSIVQCVCVVALLWPLRAWHPWWRHARDPWLRPTPICEAIRFVTMRRVEDEMLGWSFGGGEARESQPLWGKAWRSQGF